MLDIFLDVDPIPKGRPRFKVGGTYTPKRTLKAEFDIKMLIKSEMSKNQLQMTLKPVFLSVHFFLKHKRRVDIDNLLKTVADSLNDLVYKDDSQIVELYCQKVFSKKSGIQLTVNEL